MQSSSKRGGFWRQADGSAVPGSDAYAAWARAAYPVLVAVASEYPEQISYGELGRRVQADSGIHTSQLLVHWIGEVLRQVVLEAHRRGDPPLTALVVHADDRMVGDGYRLVLTAAGQAAIEDEVEREVHAAEARLACYRRYCTSLPADGGVAVLPPKIAKKLHSKTLDVASAPPKCPTCSIVLPVSGVCDDCS